MAIYITGDCHGDFDRLLDPRFSESDKNDYLIVCGDFGGVWSESQWEEQMLDRLEKELPYTLLWVDGNHAAPTMVSNYFSAWRFKADELTDYFEKIRKEVQFKRWFCGHYHVDEEMVVEGKNFQILYNKIERIY